MVYLCILFLCNFYIFSIGHHLVMCYLSHFIYSYLNSTWCNGLYIYNVKNFNLLVSLPNYLLKAVQLIYINFILYMFFNKNKSFFIMIYLLNLLRVS